MSEHITHTASIKRLERSTSDKKIAGVAGGLGRYFDLNPNVFRLGFVILTILGGAGVLVYLAAVLVMPVEGEEQSIAARALAERRERPAPLIGLGLVGVALAVLLSRGDLWPSAGAGWVLILVGGLVILWATRRERGSRRVLKVVAAVTSLLSVAVAAALIIAFSWFDVSLSDGIGDRTYEPAAAADVRPSYALGIGSLRLDLSHVASPARVTASVGIGELKVIVPRGAAVTVDGRTKAGDIYVLNRHDDGRNATVQTGNGGLVLHVKVGAGRIDVVRAQ
jgi:phage shock protein PspC (stress-responsive transcriptional regulator)